VCRSEPSGLSCLRHAVRSAHAHRARLATEERTPDRLPCAIFHRDAPGKGAMSSNQSAKSEGAKRSQESARQEASRRRDLDAERTAIMDAVRSRAVDRAHKWARLIGLLDAMLDDAHSLDRFGIPVDPLSVQACAEKTGETPARARARVVLLTASELAVHLQLAHNRLAAVEGYRYGSCDQSAVGDLLNILQGRSAFLSPQETIAAARREAEILLRADLAESHPLVTRRKPADLESLVIEVLLDAQKPLRQGEISRKINLGECSSKWATDAGSVSDAMGRLRDDCGYTLKRQPGGGFQLTEDELTLCRTHGFKIPQE
jgi:hypothetical protein